MAESLVKKIEENFLACAICFEQLTDPVGLPCLHAFCFECLENWYKTSKNKRQVVCPACKKPAPLPREGIRGFPGHFLVKNLKETVSLEKESMESPCIRVGDSVRVKASIAKPEYELGTDDVGTVTCVNGKQITVDFPGHKDWKGLKSDIELVQAKDESTTVCKLCGEAATVHCLDCKEYLCNQCHRNHNAFKAMNGHKVVKASDVLSGKITSKGRHCETHGELVRYYCETENKQVCQDCVSLKSCPVEHDRISLRDAAKKQARLLRGQLDACEPTRELYLKSISEIAEVEKSLGRSHDQAKDALEKVIQETNEKLEKILQNKKLELVIFHAMKATWINMNKNANISKFDGIQKACNLASKITNQGSDYDITYNYASLSATLRDIESAQPEAINKSLASVDFDPGKPEDYINLESKASASTGATKSSAQPRLCAAWTKKVKQFSTTNALHSLQSIVACPDGDIVVTSFCNGVKVFSPDGRVKHTFKCAPNDVFDVARTPDDRYIILGRTKLLCYDKQGKQLSTIATSSTFQKVSCPTTVAVDSMGRIIAGLQDNTISIHYADGTLASQFRTDSKPYYLSVTSQNTLVVSFWDETLKIMDYSGKVLQVLQPPPGEVSKWDPGRTCCTSDDEIFVVNEGGIPSCIFGYSTDGEYLGLISSDVSMARGITLSHDENEFIIVEENEVIKFYHLE